MKPQEMTWQSKFLHHQLGGALYVGVGGEVPLMMLVTLANIKKNSTNMIWTNIDALFACAPCNVHMSSVEQAKNQGSIAVFLVIYRVHVAPHPLS